MVHTRVEIEIYFTFLIFEPKITLTQYHFGLHSKQSNLKEKFGDVKIVCMGGSEGRIKKFAEMAYDALKGEMNLEPNCAEVNLAESAGRYVMYKVPMGLE